MGAEDREIHPIHRTQADPRTTGRRGPIGSMVVFCDDAAGIATLLIKRNTGDTDWSDQTAGAIATDDIADLAVTGGKLAAAVAAAIHGVPSITVAAQVGTARSASIQLKDITGANLAAIAHARIWISDVAGGAPTASEPDGGVALTAGVSLAELVTDKIIEAVSTAAGLITVALTHAGADTTWFVNVAVGPHVVSAAVALDN